MKNQKKREKRLEKEFFRKFRSPQNNLYLLNRNVFVTQQSQ